MPVGMCNTRNPYEGNNFLRIKYGGKIRDLALAEEGVWGKLLCSLHKFSFRHCVCQPGGVGMIHNILELITPAENSSILATIIIIGKSMKL